MSGTSTKQKQSQADIRVTRSATEVWLIGQLISVIDIHHNNQLPTTGEILCRLFHDLKVKKLTLSESCSNVINEVLLLWQAANIPTTQKPNAVSKLKMIYEKYIKTGKNKNRASERQWQIEKEFSEELKTLFDISHANSQQIIKIPEDYNFLQDQRGQRMMIMGGEDKVFKQQKERKEEREIKKIKQEEKAKAEQQRMSVVSSIATRLDKDIEDMKKSSSEDSNDDTDEFEPHLGISKYYRQLSESSLSASLSVIPDDTVAGPSGIERKVNCSKANKRRLVDDPLFISSLDRTKTSLRDAMHIVTPALQAVGFSVDELTLSTTSMHRSRKLKHLEINENIRQTFSPSVPLVVHFDNKLLPDVSRVTVERMPVVVSGMNVEKILGIPKLPSASGFHMGNAVIHLIHEWKGVADWVAALCFDTTSANTGIHNGAITVIQKKLQKRLLFLGCRHHILEILATSVFEIFFPSTGPQIAIFVRFKDAWPFINQENFASIDKCTSGCILTEKERQWLENYKNDVVEFIRQILKQEIQPRHDYLEFLKLSLIALGNSGQIPGKMFNLPGAYHHARWMAKGIYCLKILCFRNEFQLTTHEVQALKRICLFTLTIYIKMWFSAPSSCNAPFNDLHLLQTLELYKEIDTEVAMIALKKLKGQIWYLSEDLVGLAFFSDHVPPEQKSAMVAALQRPKSTKLLRRLEARQIKSFQNKTLSDFVTEQSLNLFTILKLDSKFLQSDIFTWLQRDDYIHAKEIVSSLKVVNDCAERAVKLASDFNLQLTDDEEQRQLIFQIVEHHRKLVKLPHKKNFK